LIRRRLARLQDGSDQDDTPLGNKVGRPKSRTSVELIPEKVEELSQFIHETQDLLAKVMPGIGTQMCESSHSRKAKLPPTDFDWQGSWKVRVARAVLDINRPGWRIELYYRLSLQALCHKAQEAIISHGGIVKAKASKRDAPSAKRKYRPAGVLRRNHTERMETQVPKYQGLVKRSVKKPPSIDHE
jgi:hypothetical protein